MTRTVTSVTSIAVRRELIEQDRAVQVVGWERVDLRGWGRHLSDWGMEMSMNDGEQTRCRQPSECACKVALGTVSEL